MKDEARQMDVLTSRLVVEENLMYDLVTFMKQIGLSD
jgi:hypothetical protein